MLLVHWSYRHYFTCCLLFVCFFLVLQALVALSSLYIGYPSLYHRVSTTSGMYLASTSVFDLMFDGDILRPVVDSFL